jgi:hypothetical protein
VEYSISWGGDPEDVCLTAVGVARPGDLDAMTREATTDSRWVDGMKVLMDFTRADLSSLQSGEIAERASTVMDMAPAIGRQRIAWAVAGPESLRVTRFFLLHVEWEVGFVGEVFRSLVEARAWLRGRPDRERLDVEPQPVAKW